MRSFVVTQIQQSYKFILGLKESSGSIYTTSVSLSSPYWTKDISLTAALRRNWLGYLERCDEYLTALCVDHGLGHVKNGSESLDVVPLPVPDWLC